MGHFQGLVANPWSRALGAGGLLVLGLAGCGGDGPVTHSQAASDSAASRPLPTLEIPTQSVATPPARVRTAEAVPAPDQPRRIADPGAGAGDRVPLDDVASRARSNVDQLRQKTDQTIDKTQRTVESAADDVSRKVGGAIGEVERRADRLQKQAGDIQKKADDVRDGVEQTGKALRNLIGGEGSKPRN